jgi:phosphate transport system substrate-binding protein
MSQGRYLLLCIFFVMTLFVPLPRKTLLNAKKVELLGTGATLPYPFYSKIFYEYWKKTGIEVNYQAIGSGGGQQQLLNMAVDFGASDAFMSDEALADAPGKILHLPTCLGAVAISYHLPGDPQLKFTPEVVADIFLGEISTWNDEKIVAINPMCDLPSMDIFVIHRSDGSGTTLVFSDYLCKVSKKWRTRVGRGKALNWPVGLGAKGNQGVAGMIKIFPGAIGYIELGYALSNKMTTGEVRNSTGHFILPDPFSTRNAANVSLPPDTRIYLTNTKTEKGYPISSFSWILIFQEQAYKGRTEQKARHLVNLLWWITHGAQRYAEPLHYVSLSETVQQRAENILKKMTYNGKPLLK